MESAEILTDPNIGNLTKMFSLGPRIVKQLLKENNGNVETTIDTILILTSDPLSILSSRVPALKLKEDEEQIKILEFETMSKKNQNNVQQQSSSFVNTTITTGSVKYTHNNDIFGSFQSELPNAEPIVILSDYPLKISQSPHNPLETTQSASQIDMMKTKSVETVSKEPPLEKSVDILADFVQVSDSYHPLFTIFTPKIPTEDQNIEIEMIESLLTKLKVNPKDIFKITQDENDLNSIRQLTKQEPKLPFVFLRRKQLGNLKELAQLLQDGTLNKMIEQDSVEFNKESEISQSGMINRAIGGVFSYMNPWYWFRRTPTPEPTTNTPTSSNIEAQTST